MAKSNSTTTAPRGYQFTGATPLNTLTQNTAFLRLASRLHDQAIRMADAQLTGKFFKYKPVPIPQKMLHIFQ